MNSARLQDIQSEWKSLSRVWMYTPWNSPGQNTGVGSLSLLQGIFPTQGSNPGLPHCRRILYQLSHQGSHKGSRKQNQYAKPVVFLYTNSQVSERGTIFYNLKVCGKLVVDSWYLHFFTMKDFLIKVWIMVFN